MAFGIDDAIAAGLKIIDKFIPDPELKAKMAQELENNKKDMLIANLQADNVEAQEVSKRWAWAAAHSAEGKGIHSVLGKAKVLDADDLPVFEMAKAI